MRLKGRLYPRTKKSANPVHWRLKIGKAFLVKNFILKTHMPEQYQWRGSLRLNAILRANVRIDDDHDHDSYCHYGLHLNAHAADPFSYVPRDPLHDNSYPFLPFILMMMPEMGFFLTHRLTRIFSFGIWDKNRHRYN